MNRRYLIDDVCLWYARAFVLLLFISLLLIGYYVVCPAYLHRHAIWTLDGWFFLTALSGAWLVCLAKPRSPVARGLLGVGALLYFSLLIWNFFQGGGLEDHLQISLTILGVFGYPSMIWTALRPPLRNTFVAQS